MMRMRSFVKSVYLSNRIIADKLPKNVFGDYVSEIDMTYDQHAVVEFETKRLLSYGFRKVGPVNAEEIYDLAVNEYHYLKLLPSRKYPEGMYLKITRDGKKLISSFPWLGFWQELWKDWPMIFKMLTYVLAAGAGTLLAGGLLKLWHWLSVRI